jgi:hypothetical protein
MKKLILLLFPFFIQAQDVAIGHWKDYLSYNSASYIAEADNKIYCVASGGLFYVNKVDETINRLSKTTGLSDVDVKQVAYSYEFDIVIITYENCNIDLLKNNQIINISDIKRKEITGIKSINNITISGSVAYLSTSIGLILVDLENEEIKDTYNVGDIISMYEINGCAFLGDSIIVATPYGVYFANINSQNLADYNNWTLYVGTSGNYDNILSSNTGVFVDTSNFVTSISYCNNTIIRTFYDSININNTTFLTHSKFENILYALNDNQNNIWVADSINGLLKFTNFEYQETFIPDGPTENEVYSLEYTNNKLIVCHGGKKFETPPGNKNGATIMTSNDSWRNYDYSELKNARDIIEAASRGSKIYFASYYNGVVELENDEVVEKYSWHNTNNGLDTISYWQHDNRMAIADLKFDENGNLWGLLSSVDNPLFVKTKNNTWHKFSISATNHFLFDELLIDDYNQKWGIMERGNGIFVYNDNNTIDNISDDQYKLLDMNFGSGSLPSMDIYCFENDFDGEIWIGTDKGVAVFYDPGAIFSGYNFDAQQILITEGDYGQYLLSDEKINCIKIDGANRKWIGTEKSGIFLLSEDGLEQILHFTKDNSPLFSDNIVDIAINHENGEVFIGTSKGLISYRSDATIGVSTQGETHVFPNPVNESYTGPIAISGLVADANVKITDINGNLVFETIANGGQAIWNGKNKNNERASTGVYLVFSTGLYGEEKVVSKILFIH